MNAFNVNDMHPACAQAINFGELKTLQNAKTAVTIPNHETSSVWAVYDSHARRIGYVVRARYERDRAKTWFAVDNDGRVSSLMLGLKSDALAVLQVMAAARILASGMSTATVPGM